jgi:periplasmic protein TonB
MATRVFLLSADEKAVHVITQILDEQDIRFEHSSDATFTLKRLAGQHFDVLVVDCDNPDSAMQVFNSARASNLNKGAIAVAIVEGKAGVPNAFRLGASLVLTKPVSLDQARNTLRTAVGMTKKDAVDARPVVMPAATSFSAAPAPTPAPAHVSLPAPTPVPAIAPVSVPAPPLSVAPPVLVPVAPAVKAAPVAISAPVAPTVVPQTPVPQTPLQAPSVPSAPIQLTPIPPTPAPQSIAPKPPDVVPAKITLPPSVPEVITAKESTPVEKTPSTSIAVQPKPALQLSETRVLKAEEDDLAMLAKTEKEPSPAAEKPVSLSSAMLGSSESEAAIDKLETALSASKAETKTASAIEMFAPAGEKTSEPELDAPSEANEDSTLNLRANAVPAFGGLAQQPFAGIESGKGSNRGLIIGGLVSVMAVAGFAGAWFYAPGFQKTVQWEYSRVREQFQGSAKPATTAAVKPTIVPATTPALPADSTTNAATNVTGTSAASSQAQALTVPTPAAPVTPAPTAAPAVASAAVTAPSQNAPTPKSQSPSPTPSPAATSGTGASLVNTSATTPNATAKSADLFEVPEDYADDQVIHRVHPAYPNAARVRKLQGSVVLQAIINKQGKVDSLQLVSGDPLLAQAAADAVKQWRYKPYSHNGDPVEFQTRVTVDFKLP